MNKLLYACMMPMMVSASMNECCPREENVRKDTSNIGGGYEHDGMYSQSKKIRPGAGHKKLTRAQRKKARARLGL